MKKTLFVAVILLTPLLLIGCLNGATDTADEREVPAYSDETLPPADPGTDSPADSVELEPGDAEAYSNSPSLEECINSCGPAQDVKACEDMCRQLDAAFSGSGDGITADDLEREAWDKMDDDAKKELDSYKQ